LFESVTISSIRFDQADVFDFIQRNEEPADLLIAHAFLDLLPMPESVPKLVSLTRNLAWLTINFDGVTTFEPTIDAALDAQIERLYHETMDVRPTGGDSQSGRHVRAFANAGMEILAAGASDWVVHATNGKYPKDEAYFLHFILHFFEESLANHAELETNAFANWLNGRRAQIERGELVYIAHQWIFWRAVNECQNEKKFTIQPSKMRIYRLLRCARDSQKGVVDCGLEPGWCSFLALWTYATGFELSFSFFYLIPVAMAAWAMGRKAGLAFSVLCASVWLTSNLLSGQTSSNSPFIGVWNTLLRFGFYAVVTVLLAELRHTLEEERLLANTDPLTGAMNRRSFNEIAEKKMIVSEVNRKAVHPGVHRPG
jgi:hypothetical protein